MEARSTGAQRRLGDMLGPISSLGQPGGVHHSAQTRRDAASSAPVWSLTVTLAKAESLQRSLAQMSPSRPLWG